MARSERGRDEIAFSISDTGIGIPANKQAIIFEAFQQVDGGTSRKYGDTGLGLSISREIANLLGGELCLTQSAEGVGSTFVLYIPLRGSGGGKTITTTPAIPSDVGAGPRARPVPDALPTEGSHGGLPLQTTPSVPDDRDTITPADKVLLIVEDDITFATILLGVARAKGFKGVVATSGNMVISLMKAYPPDAITLDIRLPDVSGWTVLDRIKKNPLTSHIPVHIISIEESEHQAVSQGAIGSSIKPVTQEGLNAAFAKISEVILTALYETDTALSGKAVLLERHDMVILTAENGALALTILAAHPEIAIVLMDIMMPVMDGYETIRRIRANPEKAALPIIAVTAKAMKGDREMCIAAGANDYITKPVDADQLISLLRIWTYKKG